MIVPSFSALTLMPLTLQVPPEPTVVVTAVEDVVPSLATTEIVAPTSPVPLAVVLVSLVLLMELVTEVMTTVVLVDVSVPVAMLPTASVSVTV